MPRVPPVILRLLSRKHAGVGSQTYRAVLPLRLKSCSMYDILYLCIGTFKIFRVKYESRGRQNTQVSDTHTPTTQLVIFAENRLDRRRAAAPPFPPAIVLIHQIPSYQHVRIASAR